MGEITSIRCSKRRCINFATIPAPPPGRYLGPHGPFFTKPIKMGITTITQRQWLDVMNTAPWKSKRFVKEGDDYPAVHIDIIDAIKFCEKLTELTGNGLLFRLPTEYEWEYACSGGATTLFSFGDNDDELENYAWFQWNTSRLKEEYAHKVAQKLPNQFGLYDMHGNVSELTQSKTNSGLLITRGGSWDSGIYYASTSRARVVSPIDTARHDIGFRVCIDCRLQGL